ncbi:Gfo/Idh/MocA family oxidoreductase [Paraburkholderia sp. USG1]|uniref:Gfo/Idh/MocA family protein n=1 Tax=Paraburkholderia sp. USG1 TaxID=2952268 RepID=UPI00287086A9|nr:Gfo/Idh/MocA family oxidoreductase [Paraburkholderia sp. USG1]
MTSQSSTAPGPTIRVGLIGVGNWAKHGHLRVLKLLHQYEITAVYSQRLSVSADIAREYGVKHVMQSVDDLVNHPDVDLVIVLTTAPQHADGVRAAIAAGKNVYCEWPLTHDVNISKELVDLAHAANVRHIVGLQRRLAPHNRYVHDLIQQGYIGKLRSVRIHVSMNYFQPSRSIALRWTVPPENFSSVIAIYAGHFLDMLFASTGWPNELSALVVNQFKEVTIIETGEKLPNSTPDQMVLTGRLADEAVLTVHIEGGKRNGSGVQIDITGTEGDLRITNRSAFGGAGDNYKVEGARGDNLPLQVLPVPDAYNQLPPSELPSSVLELAELYAAYSNDVRDGTKTAPDFSDAVRMHELINAAVTSSETGRHIVLAASES